LIVVSSFVKLKEGGKKTKMKKLLKSKKALSPVVAAIILIAVTVAVSIAVAVWMGSLSFNFMNTENLQITNVAFSGATDNAINVTVLNTGTTDVTIVSCTVTGLGAGGAGTIDTPDPALIGEGESEDLDITLAGTWTAGNLYNIELLSSKGNKFTYTATA
jgi:flagellin-like protein